MTPCRENETFVCRVGFGSRLSRRSSVNQPRSSSKTPQRDPDQALDHATLFTPVRAISAPISGSDSCVPASSHQPLTRWQASAPRSA